MKQMTLFTTLCLVAYADLAAGESISLPVTAAHERLVVALWEGDIAVTTGRDTNVVIASDCSPREPEPSNSDRGFRSLRSSALLPSIVPGDEVIAIRTYEDDPQCSVTLTVPEQLDLNARINHAGSIRVDAFRGRLLAWSADGDVNVANYSGSLSVTAMSGDANVSLADAGIDADSAITAANGTLTLTVNPDHAPALRAQARWGEVQTNLDTPFRQVVEAGGTWFATERDDAEPLLTMRNLNRDIVIRSPGPDATD